MKFEFAAARCGSSERWKPFSDCIAVGLSGLAARLSISISVRGGGGGTKFQAKSASFSRRSFIAVTDGAEQLYKAATS